MATFPLILRNAQQNAHSAKTLARIAREVEGNVQDEKMRQQHTAADGLTLRGIPAIGRGVTGAIPGTVPHSVR